MHIQINSFGFTVIRLHRLYIKILEDITSVSRTHLPKDFKRSFLKVRDSFKKRNEEDKRAETEGTSF